MEEQCLLHRQPIQAQFHKDCHECSFVCRECVFEHPQGSEHAIVGENTLSELKSLTKKNQLRRLIERYFVSKKVELTQQLDEQLADVMQFIDYLPSTDPREQMVSDFIKMLSDSDLKRTCSQIGAYLSRIHESYKSNPNPESEANEQERMRLFERLEQHCIEFRLNSNHALKDLKRRIEGALKKDIPEPLTAKKHFFSGSSIIGSLADCKLICQFLVKKVKAANLLYRATENDFSVRVFHEKCDGIRNTLTVLRNDLKKTLGGFSPLAWQSNLGYLADSQRQTFIFSMDLKQKMQLEGKYGVWNSSSYGPSFGYGNYGHDLCICDRADKNKASYAEFPLSFNNEKKYQNNQQTWQLFCGQTKGNNFNVVEWEVWRIQFE